jgi:hypothetical protein
MKPLDTIKVGDIRGNFIIPSYQRGYRWGESEVRFLIQDILENGPSGYCLQPIVVKDKGDGDYELIDGQQRLTTLYLIYKFFHISSNGFLDDVKFTIEYKTREKSAQFLKDIDLSQKEDNIDFFFMANAYEMIKEAFSKEDKTVITQFNEFLKTKISVIWYQISSEENAVDLFTRLNIGKIPLTNAELVKALFLKESAEDILSRQEEIALLWDNMERELTNDAFWSFLTNKKVSDFETPIDLILDLIARKPEKEYDKLYTFLHFDDENKKGKKLYDIWLEIYNTFLTLKDWFEEHDYYHKIGYLVASDSLKLHDILNEYTDKNLTKKDFNAYLDEEIRRSITFDKSHDDLNYINDSDEIQKLLLLFNVESMRTVDDGNQRFPFNRFKSADWSLEHIHAQHSEGLQTNDKRKNWMEDHIPSLTLLIGKNRGAERIISEMQVLIKEIETLEKPIKIQERFEPLRMDTVELFSQNDGTDYIHSLANMALLNCGDNAALSNYVFDAKRNIVIEWDKQGKYLPLCTKRVFLKYYTKSEDSQLHFWGINDRRDYVKAINQTLKDYLQEPIVINSLT